MKKKSGYLLTVLLLVIFLVSCEKTATTTNEKEEKQDTLINKLQDDLKGSDNLDNKINLEPILSNAPQFSDANTNTFVTKMKKYCNEIEKAVKEKNGEKEIELQQQAIDLDSEYLEVKEKLNSTDQKKLEDWYMKIVERAAY